MTVETAASDATGVVERDTVAARPPVSVVVPAFNAADTLGETLESLQAQSHRHWEALVVDDGSTDNTLVVAGNAAGGDPRIRVLSIGHRGESGARNAGIAEARFEWLLFLDADDWLTRDALEALTDEIARDPGLDLVYGSWTYVTPDGEEIAAHYPGTTPEHLFSTSARTFPFAVHACLVRRSRVLEVGGFDPTFVTCPDWDLWQRLGRAGVRCRLTDKRVARYRVRPGSASFNVPQVLQDGLRVIRTGFGEDPRVRFPRPELAHGLERAGLPSALWCFTAAVAGVALSAGKRPIDLVEPLRSEREPGLDPFAFGRCLVAGGMLPFYRVSAWEEVWRRDSSKLDEFLDAVERCAVAPGFSRQVPRALELHTLIGSKQSWPRTLGRTHAEVVDIGAAIPDIRCASDVETLLCRTELQSIELGTLELPVFDGVVPAGVVADAAAAEFGWTVLQRFFATSLFSQLHLERTPEGLAVWRGDVRFSKVVPPSEPEPPSPEALHRAAGWGLFLQELWGRPQWPSRRFYDLDPDAPDVAPPRKVHGSSIAVEISDELHDVAVGAPWLDVAVTVAGAAAGTVRVPVSGGRVAAQALRRAITAQMGFELCVVAVREALVGQPLADGRTLRSRLQDKVSAGRAVAPGLPPGVVGTSPLLDAVTDQQASLIILGRRPDAQGTSACRRASLPAAAATELTESARANEEPSAILGRGRPPVRVAYAPDLLWPGEDRTSAADPALLRNRAASHGNGIGGASTTRASMEPATSRLPILAYHRVCRTTSRRTAGLHVDPTAFEEQLHYLRDAGFRSVSLEEWRQATATRSPVPGRALAITFDGGYLDFAEHAWPLLQKYGFDASIFVATDLVGRTHFDGHGLDDEAALLNWTDLRGLQADGVSIGSHSASPRSLVGRPPVEVAREVAASRAKLAEELGAPVRTFAYPFGLASRALQHLVGACGYSFGLTRAGHPAGWQDSLLALPRQVVTGCTTLSSFMRRLPL